MDRKDEREAELERDVEELFAKYSELNFLLVAFADDNSNDYTVLGNACGRCAAEKIVHWVITEKINHQEIKEEIKH